MEYREELSIFGKPVLSRKRELEEKIKESQRVVGLDFMGKYRDINVVEVSIDFPVYRLLNGRTRTFQREFLAENPTLRKDLFISDHDSYDAQEAQHRILLKLVEEEDLLKSFKSENLHQTEPLICTYDGIIVNGNRRLCAWRELYWEDKEQFKHFQTIFIAILPKCEERDIEELEKRLQIQNSMRAQYRWHNIAIMAKEEIQKGYKEQEVAKSYDLSTQAMRLLIDSRDYAEQYLVSINKPDRWSLVDKSYYAFEQIVKGRRKLMTEGEKELFEALANTFIASGNAEGRLYEFIPEIVENLKPISDRLQEHLEINNNVVLDDTMSDLLVGDETILVDISSNVALKVREHEDKDSIQTVIKRTIETQKQLKNEKSAENFLLSQLTKSVSLLQNAIDNGISDKKVNIQGVEKQLNTILEKVSIIKKWLDEKNAA